MVAMVQNIFQLGVAEKDKSPLMYESREVTDCQVVRADVSRT